jgi:hypothetical protein
MIKAIETRYKGYRFRSRLEARWAVFFDALGIKWEYEKEGYDLGEAGYYLPDFWVNLGERNYIFDIKSVYPSSEEIEKIRKLGGYIVSGLPGVDNHIYSYVIVNRMSEEEGEWNLHSLFCGCRYCGKSIGIESAYGTEFSIDVPSNDPWIYTSYFSCCHPEKDFESTFYDSKLMSAYIAARSARFEHGEKGYPHA